MASIKKAMSDVTGLHTFDRKRICILAADGSKQAIGAVAGHAVNPEDDENLTAETKYYPCMFLGRSFRDAEYNYSQPEREMLSIAYGVDKIAPYIGSRLIILTDHKAWVQLQNMQCANRRVDKWRQIIAQLPQLPGYPKFIFRKGTEQKDVDPLSRTDHIELPGESNLDEYLTDKVEDPTILSGLYKLTQGWEPYDSITLWLSQGKLNQHQTESEQRAIKVKALNYYYFDGVLYRRPKPGSLPRRVPQLEEIPRLLNKYHGDDSDFGHLQISSTYQLMSFTYYWKNMYDHILNHIESCSACSAKRRKNPIGRYELYRMTPPPSLFMFVIV